MARRIRAAVAVAAVLAAPAALGYVQARDRTSGVPLAWPLPAVPWHLNRDWPNSAPSCRPTASGYDPTVAAVRSSFAAWELPCTDLRLLYAGGSAETSVGAAGHAGNVVVFRRGWCSQNPDVVDPVTHVVKDPCFTAADGDCGGRHDCFDDGPACVGKTAAAPCSPTWGIVALTSTLYDPATGAIVSADIEVNGWDGQAGTLGGLPQHGWWFTCFPGPQPSTCTGTYAAAAAATCSYIDLQNTVTHEVGHVLGLAHPCTTDGSVAGLPLCSMPVPDPEVPYTARTMAPTTQPGDTGKRRLSQDEVDAMCTMYATPAGGCACGAASGAGAVSLLAAALALRPRRPRALTRR
jgi:hypothetical protein